MMNRIAAIGGGLSLSFSLVAHFWPMQSAHLSRQAAWVAVLAVALLLWPAVRLFIRALSAAWAVESVGRRRLALAACLGFGAFISVESCATFALWGDNLWLQPPPLQPWLRALLHLSDALVVTGVLGALLTVAVPPCGADSGESAPGRVGAGRCVWFVGALVLAWVNAVVARFVAHERTAHYWDYAGYWLACSDFASVLAADPGGAWRQLLESLRVSEYTLLPAAVPGVVLVAAGDSRLAYELAVANIYGGAVVAAAVWAVARSRPGERLGPLGCATVAGLGATCAPLWTPVLLGYLDFGGVALGLGLFGVYLSRPACELRWDHALAMGVLLAALVLFRRWYGFWVVAFLAVALAEAALGAVRRRTLAPRDWRPALASGGIALTLVAVFAWPMVLRVAGSNYAESYAGYRAESGVWGRLRSLAGDLGWVHLAAFAAALVAAAANLRSRRAALFAAAMPVVILAHFYRVQDMGPHHRLLLAPSYLLVGGLALARLAESRRRWPGLILAAALAATVWGLTFEPRLDSFRVVLVPWATRWPTYPERRGDMAELLALAGAANAEAGARGTAFVVAASSNAFNQMHLLTVHRSQGLVTPAPWRQAMLPEVDKVSGYPTAFFAAEVAVGVDPPQIHLRPQEQVAMHVLAQQVWAGKGVGAAFEPAGRIYRLDGGVRARVFVRQRPSTPAELESFDAAWRAAHPGLPIGR